MDKTLLRIALACGLGGGVGALAGLELAQSFNFYPGVALTIGALLGALVGYMTYHPKQVWAGLKHAWRVTLGRDVSTPVLTELQKLWSERHAIAKGGAISLGYLILAVIGWFITANLSNYALSFLVPEWGKNYPRPLPGWALLWPIVPLTVGSFISLVFCVGTEEDGEPLHPKDRLIMTQIPLLGFLAPFALIGALLWLIVRKRFAYPRTFLRFIHSEMRVLCAFDSALGAAAGFLFGSAIVGGLAGLAFGFASYEIISKRWLKLVPAKVPVSTDLN